MRETMKKVLLWMMILCMVFSTTALVHAESNSVSGGDTISESGIYQVASDAVGIITIADGLNVTLQGSGVDTAPNEELSIKCGKNTTLTLENLYIKNETDMNAVDFSGKNNTLKSKGINLIEGTVYYSSAVVHVGPDAELTFDDGGGILYLYKYTAGSGIGGNMSEANGKITFNGGKYFLKGSKTGAVIGNDVCEDAEKSAQIGDITINGGELYIEANARGSAIGGSNMSPGGRVVMTGGLLTIYNDWTGSAIGGGDSVKNISANNGTFEVSGGSVKVYVTDNSAGSWGVKEASACDNPVTAEKVNSDGDTVVRYLLDVSEYTANAEGDAYSVAVDGNLYYAGGLHDYEYVKNESSTIANWTKTESDKYLYLYLTEGNHTISVNGSESQNIEVKEPIYDDGNVEVPDTNWIDYADTSWYTPEETSYKIGTAAQLAGLAKLVNEGTDSFEGKTISLSRNINLQAHEWTPIGVVEEKMSDSTGFDNPDSKFQRYMYYIQIRGKEQFESSYYGNLISISEFRGDFNGNGHTIYNLWIGNLTKRGHGLFHTVFESEISNLEVSGGYIEGYSGVSAIAAYAYRSSFSNCISNVNMYAKATGSTGGGTRGDYLGGIAGMGCFCDFSNCKNYGTINGNRYVGGIVGGGSGTFTKCTNYADLSTIQEGCAGIIAFSYGKTVMTDCINYGDLKGLMTAGLMYIGNSYDYKTYTLSDLIFEGEEWDCRILRCVNNGNLTGGADSGAGGAGILFNTPTRGFVSIKECVNTGNIQLVGRDSSASGGIVGELKNGIVTDCYNTGFVDNSGSLNEYYGGIVGYFLNKNSSTSRSEIKNCYNTGSVSSCRETDYVGGIVGYGKITNEEESSSGISNNYYLQSAAEGGINGEDKNGSAEALSTDALKKAAARLGSAFSSDKENLNDGYPVLRWQLNQVPDPVYGISLVTSANTAHQGDVYTVNVIMKGEPGEEVPPAAQFKFLCGDTAVISSEAKLYNGMITGSEGNYIVSYNRPDGMESVLFDSNGEAVIDIFTVEAGETDAAFSVKDAYCSSVYSNPEEILRTLTMEIPENAVEVSVLTNDWVSCTPYAADKYLVKYTGEVADGNVAKYNGTDMLYSEKYNAWIAVINEDVSESIVNKDVTVEAGTKTSVDYSGDVNLSGKINIVDAQLAYDIASKIYADFSKADLAMWCRADVNVSGTVEAADARAIQCIIHGINA